MDIGFGNNDYYFCTKEIRSATYPSFKSTSIPCLPQMPEHCDALKAKYIFKEPSEKGYPDEPFLAATQTKGVVALI